MRRYLSTLRSGLLTVALLALAPVAVLAVLATWGVANHMERLQQDDALLLAHTANLRLEQGHHPAPSAETLGLPAGARLWIVDNQGNAEGDGLFPALPPSDIPFVPTTVRIGDRWLASVPMDEPGRRLVVIKPPGTHGLATMLGEMGGGLAAALALSLTIAWTGVRRLVLTKVERLEMAAGRIRAGESGVRSGLASDPGEFGSLARTFDAMAAALDRRTRDLQHSLRASDDRFQQMARAQPCGIFRTDADLRVTYVNPRCVVLAGRSEAALLAGGWQQCVHPEDEAWVGEIVERAHSRGMAVDLPECRVLRPDGSIVWVLVRDALERDGDGAIIGRIATVVDVTTLKHTTEALRESEERFRKLARIVPVGIFRTDGEGDCTYANDSLATILGRPKQELRQQNWRDLLHPDDRARLDEAGGEPGSRELRLVRPDGRDVWVLVREVDELDWRGAAVGRIGTMSDITGQIMARDALRLSEERFRVALKHSPVAVFAQDHDLRYTWMFNGPPGSEMIVGHREEEIFSPEEGAHLTAIKHDVMLSRCGRREEVTCTLADITRTYDTWYEPMLDEHGTVTGLVGAAVDITKMRQLNAALDEAREQAEQANEAKSRFLAAASHDLRQPFQAMRLFRAALVPFLTAPRAEAIATKLDEAMTAGEQLLTALLDISTLEAGIVAPKAIPISAADLVARLAREFQPQVEAHGLALKVHLCPALVRTDPVLLERILRNLLHNAVRYTHAGGILLAARRRGDRLVFQVWDTGIGIPAEQQERVFEDFYQIGNPGRDRSHGLGLGLSVVARTARLLDHPVTLQSRHGQGSVFSVSVPLAAGQAEAAA
jgi:PAS domain S-box-containing protein